MQPGAKRGKNCNWCHGQKNARQPSYGLCLAADWLKTQHACSDWLVVNEYKTEALFLTDSRSETGLGLFLIGTFQLTFIIDHYQ